MVEGAIYKVNPVLREDDSDCVDNWDQDINQEDHSKIFTPNNKKVFTQSFTFSFFERKNEV